MLKSIVDAELKDVKNQNRLFLSYEDVVSISKIDGLLDWMEKVEFTFSSHNAFRFALAGIPFIEVILNRNNCNGLVR